MQTGGAVLFQLGHGTTGTGSGTGTYTAWMDLAETSRVAITSSGICRVGQSHCDQNFLPFPADSFLPFLISSSSSFLTLHQAVSAEWDSCHCEQNMNGHWPL